MTDLRTAAQAVVDIWNDPSLAIEPAIEALRQALAEPVEPVTYVDLDFLKEDSHAYAFVKRHNSRQTPLYTTPPSVNALIAEIDGLTVQHFSEKGVDYFCYEMGEVNAILDKYRGKK